MKRQDLRSRIIPTNIDNTDESQSRGNKKFNTTDLIYIDSYNEQFDGKRTDTERRISATDYAQMNNANIYDDYTTRTGKKTTGAWLRTATFSHLVTYVHGDGDRRNKYIIDREVGLCPSLHYKLPTDVFTQSELQFSKEQKNEVQVQGLEQFDVREVKDCERKNYISYITNW